MNQQRHPLLSPQREVKNDRSPISGIWIKWSALTQSERVVCAGIVLIPLWWVIGWTYTFLLVVLGIFSYEVMFQGSLRLQRPSLIVVSAVAFGLQRLVTEYINSPAYSLNALMYLINTWICFGLILWYIESKNIRVRLEVLAWACSVLVIQMLLLWIVIYFGFKEPYYTPPRSLFALLTNKGERFIPGSGFSNYLLPYWPDDKLPGGMARFGFFFPVPEAFATVVCFIILLALDIKNRLWSVLLFSSSIFLLFLSGTRALWFILPIVLGIRYVFIFGKVWGPSLVYAFIAIVSFVMLSLPPVTDFATETYTTTTETASNLRQDSTEVRTKIYTRTLDAIVSEPDKLILGRGVPGPTVLPGYEPARLGTHSFILGTLLYRCGLLGTGIFLTFWVSLFLKYYKTRETRPICSLLVILYITISFTTMDLDTPGLLVIALSTLNYQP